MEPSDNPKPNGLYVVLRTPPGPDSEFVELEDHTGRSVGSESGATWSQHREFHQLGPFAPMSLVDEYRKALSTIEVLLEGIPQWVAADHSDIDYALGEAQRTLALPVGQVERKSS